MYIKEVLAAGVKPAKCQDIVDIIKLLEVDYAADKDELDRYFKKMGCEVKW